jgi:hypothetical protein
MKFAIAGAALALFLNTPTLLADGVESVPLEDILVDADDVFVQCTLTDGRTLFASTFQVSVGDEILSKEEPTAEISTSADYLNYEGPSHQVSVYRQFCGREGYQGVIITHLNATDLESTVEELACRERVPCE